MSPRRPRTKVSPPAHKGAFSPAAVVGTPDHYDERTPSFSFLHADRAYAGGWSWPDDVEAGEILRFLCEMSRYTWREITDRRRPNGKVMHHEQPIETVCPEAQSRITELGLDAVFERLFRFELGSRKRLWGFATEGVFYVLWWDRDHQVCPIDG
jgi:hypothetical protein